MPHKEQQVGMQPGAPSKMTRFPHTPQKRGTRPSTQERFGILSLQDMVKPSLQMGEDGLRPCWADQLHHLIEEFWGLGAPAGHSAPQVPLRSL